MFRGPRDGVEVRGFPAAAPTGPAGGEDRRTHELPHPVEHLSPGRLSAAVLSQHILQCIASAHMGRADEKPLHVLDVKNTRLSYLWTFLPRMDRANGSSPTASSGTEAARRPKPTTVILERPQEVRLRSARRRDGLAERWALRAVR